MKIDPAQRQTLDGLYAKYGVRSRGENDFVGSRAFLRAKRQQRLSRTFRCSIDGIEPRKKASMPKCDKAAIQKALLAALVAQHRRAYTGKVGLQITLRTSHPTPTHSYNVVKNLLDLFGRPDFITSSRSGLLYHDDQQVQALSVTCWHGHDEPGIHLEAYRFSDLLEDIRLAASLEERDEDVEDHDWAESYTEMRDDAAFWTHAYGSDAAYQTNLRVNLRFAQDQILGRTGLRMGDIDNMFNAQPYNFVSREWFEKMFTASPLRIRLSGLPQRAGTGDAWCKEIDRKLSEFRHKWKRLLQPLVIPIAVEVLIKPPPAGKSNEFDLDNVMRKYILPRMVGQLNPVSDPAFIFNEEAEQYASKDGSEAIDRFPTPPISSKYGVARYDAWRLPEANSDDDAFVVIGIVSDLVGVDGVFRRTQDLLEKWDESQDDL